MNGKTQKSILLVEDEVLISMTKKMELEKYGYKVIIANTGEKAVDTFKDGHAIDLVLMDINLGRGIDGTEAAQLILNSRDVPIVFVSSHTEPEVVEKTEKITSYGYVVKSSSITVLDASIKMAFKLFEANRKVKESENQYHALVDGMPGIVYSFSNRRDGFFHSSSVKEILGHTPEQLRADPLLWQNSIHPDDLPHVKEVISKSWNGVPFKIEYRIRDVRGGWHLFDDRSFGFRYNGDEVIIDGLALDITSLRQAEEEIQARDIRLRKLFANIPDLVYQFTRRPDGSYYVPIASQGIRNIFGCSPEDVLDDFEPIGRVIHPEDAARVIADIEYSAEHLSYFTCEFRVILPGKGIQWIYSRSSPERLPDGNVTWHGFNANITGMKLKEQETERAKVVLQASIESPKDLIIMAIDSDYRYLCFNTAHSLAMKVAYGKEVAIGMNILDCMTSTEDRVNAQDNYDRALRGESHSTLQEYGDFEKTYFESHYNPIYNDKGEVIGITAFARDITERKVSESSIRESEEKYRALFEQATVGVAQIETSTGGFAIINAKYCDIVGYSQEELVGRNFMELTHPDDLQADMENMTLLCQNKIRDFTMEKRYIHKSGSLVWVKLSVSALWQPGEKQEFHIAIVEDISDRKLAEESLKKEEDLSRHMLEFTAEMLLSGSAQVSFQKILENLLFLTNAKYGIMTLLEDRTGKYTTVAAAGIKEHVRKITEMLGVELVGKAWPEYSTSNEKLEGKNVSHFASLSDLVGSVLPHLVTKAIEKLLDMGEVTVTKVLVNNTMIGDFTLVMPSGKQFESDTLVEIYSKQINMFMTRVKAEEDIKRLNDTNLELLHELQHRAKNSFNMISSMVGMAGTDAASIETKRSLDYLGSRINSISELYSLLYSAGSFDGLQLDDYLFHVARPLIALSGNISLKTELEIAPVSMKSAAPLGLILTELVTNAVKYAFPGGRKGTVTVRSKKIADGKAILEVLDDGVGLPGGFDFTCHAGMGLNLVQGLARQINGVFRMDKGVVGTKCTLEFDIDSK